MIEIKMTVNGREQILEVGERELLIDVLRDRLHLKGTKRGCNTSNCGACKVLIDGKSAKSCSTLAKNCDGKTVTTIEGIADGETLAPVQEAFIDSGAVQCGYCTPGMIIETESLLRQTPHPTEEEILDSFKDNLCRCTGYKKIIEAVRLTEVLKSGEVENPEDGKDDRAIKMVGVSTPIRDAREKVTGNLRYTGDLEFPGMLYAKMLLSPHPHARILSIDTSEAEAMPGVYAVATHLNSPMTLYNSALRFYEHNIPKTETVFAQTVRFVGDRVAAVAAETPAIAEAAVKKIKVEYELLDPILSIEEALKEDSLPLHGDSNVVVEMKSEAGEIDRAFEEAARVFEGVYASSPQHQAAMENHITVAEYTRDHRLIIHTACQNTFAFRIILAEIMGMPLSKVRMIRPALGGAFGGKLEVTIEPVAAVLARMTGRPVRLELTRTESIIATHSRHASQTKIRTAVNEEGEITAQEFDIVINTGAYASSALNVLGALSHKIYKLYKTPNIRFRGQAVYTNYPIAGAMRGYGSPQVFLGQQLQMQEIAETMGIDLLDLQLRNAVLPDSVDVRFGSSILNPRLHDCLERGGELFKWAERKEALARKRAEDPDAELVEGIGLAVGAHGNGVFGAHRDCITQILRLNEDGSLSFFTGTHDMGNGSVTVQTQVLAHELQVPMDLIQPIETDTDAVAWNLGDYASRGVYVQSGCTLKLASSMREKLLQTASSMLDLPAEELELGIQKVAVKGNPGSSLTFSELAVYSQQTYNEDIMVTESYSSPAGETSYGAHFVHVRVNRTTKEIKVLDYTAVHDVGFVMNRMGLEGQLEGGIMMGIGAALWEDLSVDEQTGVTRNRNFRNYKIARMSDAPHMTIEFIEEGSLYGPYGAKSIGEVAVVPGPPAVANAVADALGIHFHSVPVSLEWPTE